MEPTKNNRGYLSGAAIGQTRELGGHASMYPRLLVPMVATQCATCGSEQNLVAYDSEGWVCFCRDCTDGLDTPSEWTDIGVCD